MQSTISVAAMILAAAAMVMATVGIGTCKTMSELTDTRVGSLGDVHAAKWGVPVRRIRPQTPAAPRPPAQVPTQIW